MHTVPKEREKLGVRFLLFYEFGGQPSKLLADLWMV
jgi:hypothetical protein